MYAVDAKSSAVWTRGLGKEAGAEGREAMGWEWNSYAEVWYEGGFVSREVGSERYVQKVIDRCVRWDTLVEENTPIESYKRLW